MPPLGIFHFQYNSNLRKRHPCPFAVHYGSGRGSLFRHEPKIYNKTGLYSWTVRFSAFKRLDLRSFLCLSHKNRCEVADPGSASALELDKYWPRVYVLPRLTWIFTSLNKSRYSIRDAFISCETRANVIIWLGFTRRDWIAVGRTRTRKDSTLSRLTRQSKYAKVIAWKNLLTKRFSSNTSSRRRCFLGWT